MDEINFNDILKLKKKLPSIRSIPTILVTPKVLNGLKEYSQPTLVDGFSPFEGMTIEVYHTAEEMAFRYVQLENQGYEVICCGSFEDLDKYGKVARLAFRAANNYERNPKEVFDSMLYWVRLCD